MFLWGTRQDRVLFRAGVSAFTRRLAAVVPSANALEVGWIVIVATGYVINVSGFIPAAFAVGLDHLAAPTAPVEYERAQ